LEYRATVSRRPTLTTTSLVILGQLALRPFPTYELAQQMRRNFRYIWPRAESGIYAEAKALVTLGMAEAEKTYLGKRPRTTYRITKKGREALAEWLASPPEGGLALDFEGLVRIFFGNFAEERDLLATLEQARRDATVLLDVAHEVGAEYVEGRAPFQQQVHVRALVFDFLFSFAHMVRDWTDRAAADVHAWQELDLAGRRSLGQQRIADALARKTSRRP
jgi:DNA-binding PadR family transcriptional regulator